MELDLVSNNCGCWTCRYRWHSSAKDRHCGCAELTVSVRVPSFHFESIGATCGETSSCVSCRGYPRGKHYEYRRGLVVSDAVVFNIGTSIVSALFPSESD